MSVEMIHATVQLDQPLGDGSRTVVTQAGFIRETVGLIDQWPKAIALATLRRANDAPNQTISATNAAALVSK